MTQQISKNIRNNAVTPQISSKNMGNNAVVEQQNEYSPDLWHHSIAWHISGDKQTSKSHEIH